LPDSLSYSSNTKQLNKKFTSTRSNLNEQQENHHIKTVTIKEICADAVELGRESFRQSAGCDELPAQFAMMLQHTPETFAGYALMRAGVMREKGDGGALDIKTKSLIFVILCIMTDDIANATLHLKNAVKKGLTMPEFVEALTQVLMVGGISRWNKGCAALLAEAEKLFADPETAADHDVKEKRDSR
jgi:alkylhydroperoxidase/carboxymuconolactone decarboxylase family protein YurZ